MTREDVEALAIGGSILGGGGGGWSEAGRQEGMLAIEIGEVELWDADEAPDDWEVVTCAALGAPTQRGNTKPSHYIRSVQLLMEVGVEFDGLIAAENGGHNSFGGWIPAAALNMPVVDTPGDGRAHPTALMGSMGLHRQEYDSVKAGCTEGSDVVTWGSLETTSNVIRSQARDMKALIAMARDPVRVAYSRRHGAPGAIGLAIELGKEYLKAGNDDPHTAVEAAIDFLGGELVCVGEIRQKSIRAQGGFDVGSMAIEGDGETFELTYVNEYMTLEKEGERLATFPDLLTTFNGEGLPSTSASLKQGEDIYLALVDKEKIPIGDGNRYAENYAGLEEALNKPMVTYLEDYLYP